jgi:hypothetical protein
MDIVLLFYPVALAAVFLIAEDAPGKRVANYVRLSAAVWVFTVIAALGILGYYRSVLGAVEWSRSARQQLIAAQAYFSTGDVDRLHPTGGDGKFNLTYPNPQRLAKVLGDPDVIAILPPELRPGGADNSSARNRMLLKGSLAGATATAVDVIFSIGPALFALGVGLFFAAGARRSFDHSSP